MSDEKETVIIVIAFLIFAFSALTVAYNGMTKAECYKAAQVNHNIKCE